VDEVLTALELTVGEKGALIEVDHLGTLIGDATQLAQLFQNLLINALKFSKSHVPPHIRVSSQMVNVAHLPERFQPPGSQESFCAIWVTDNGIGFDPEQAERIFGTFQRLHGKSQYPGIGIGLAIAKKVVANHGGYIMAESQVGQGATFTIYLPTTNPDAE
jgi:signal transduction histidine kinase